jgi:hypothetical protein
VVNSYYWNKDSNSLFDYEADEYVSSSAKVCRNGYLYRKEKDLYFLERPFKEKGTISQVVRCQAKADSFELDFDDDCDMASVKSIDEKPWLIIRHTGFVNKSGYKLKENDIIRLGKSMFRVLEIHLKKGRRDRNGGTIAEPNTNMQYRDESSHMPANEASQLEGHGHFNTALDVSNNTGVDLIQIGRQMKTALPNSEQENRYLYVNK